MFRRVLLFAPVVLLLLLAACATPDEAPPTAAAVAAASTDTLPAATATTEATTVPRPTVTPQPTPIIPAILVQAQPLTEAGQLEVENIVAEEAGWIVLLSDNNGRPGEILGYAPVVAGENPAVAITLEAQAATPTLHLRLHRDSGDSGEFEFPGPDTAVETAGAPVLAGFQVDIQIPIPHITAADQEIGPDGLVEIESVLAAVPGWIVVHRADGNEIGPALGQVTVEAGQHENLELPIRWQEASAELVAILYEDAAQPGGFDAAADLPVLIGGEPVDDRFQVTLPPDIAAYDQPVVNGRLAIERVTIPQDGWLVVYTTNEDQLDTIIGFAPLEAGINERLAVEVVETAATEQLAFLLHEESGDPGEFDFPAADLPLSYEGRLLPPVYLLTNPGNYLITADQTLGEDSQITVPLVVADLDNWLGIYTTGSDGGPDQLLGEQWLPAGINRDVQIMLRDRITGEPLLAVLHRDAGTPGEFDYPDGDDLPLQRNRQVIMSPFTLEEPATNNAINPTS